MEKPATYSTTDGNPPETITIAEAEDMIVRLGGRVAPSYTNDEQDAEVYEIYDEGETADDYPNGDPYADILTIPYQR